MAETRIATLKAIFHPWYIKALAGAGTGLGFYDIASNQFPDHIPKLETVLGMSGSFLPWWGWLLVLQAVFVYALFEYVRISIPGQPMVVAGIQPIVSSKEDVRGRERRRGIIVSARNQVNVAASQGLRNEAFRQRLEIAQVYLHLRPHLSEGFLKLMAPPRKGAVVVAEGPSRICSLAQHFLDEVDRIEREWDVA